MFDLTDPMCSGLDGDLRLANTEAIALASMGSLSHLVYNGRPGHSSPLQYLKLTLPVFQSHGPVKFYLAGHFVHIL